SRGGECSPSGTNLRLSCSIFQIEYRTTRTPNHREQKVSQTCVSYARCSARQKPVAPSSSTISQCANGPPRRRRSLVPPSRSRSWLMFKARRVHEPGGGEPGWRCAGLRRCQKCRLQRSSQFLQLPSGDALAAWVSEIPCRFLLCC